MTTESLETRIARIEDLRAITTLMNTYCARADAFDWVGWALTFTDDSVFEFPGAFGTMRGRDEIRETCKGLMDPVYDVMQHLMSNFEFELTGPDSAIGHGNLVFTGIADPAKQNQYFMSGGRYDWKFERTADGWRIAHTRLDFIWNNGADEDQVFADREAAQAA